MKKTNGWISNSSSSSFILKFEQEVTEEDCKRFLDNTFGQGERPVQINKLYESFQRITSETYDDFWLEGLITKEEVKEEEEKGFILYYLNLSDHPGDSDGIVSVDDYENKDYEILENEWSSGYMPDEVIAYENGH